MRFISKKEAQQVIGPHVSKIIASIENGHADYFDDLDNAKFRTVYTTSTAASAVHDHIIQRLDSEFHGVPGVYLKPVNNLVLMRIHNEGKLIALRFNKFDDKLQSRINNTYQSKNYVEGELKGMPDHAPLFAGYLLNKLTNALEGIYITCRSEKINEWVWDLRDSAKEQLTLFEFPNIIPSNNEQTKIGRKVKLLYAKDDQKDEIK